MVEGRLLWDLAPKHLGESFDGLPYEVWLFVSLSRKRCGWLCCLYVGCTHTHWKLLFSSLFCISGCCLISDHLSLCLRSLPSILEIAYRVFFFHLYVLKSLLYSETKLYVTALVDHWLDEFLISACSVLDLFPRKGKWGKMDRKMEKARENWGKGSASQEKLERVDISQKGWGIV